jgi:pimeloyl-ACP methyl ester carboxylesterase
MKTIQNLLMALSAMVSLCYGFGKGHKPLKTLSYTAGPVENRHLIVFLRGFSGTSRCLWSPHKCFETEGFVEAVRNRYLPFDMVAPNTHFGYYKNRTLEKRLTEDVIRPAKAKGYERIWLAGVSMGGLGSLLCLRRYPEHIDGVLLLGPYLGGRSIAAEISKEGGIRKWNPEPYNSAKDWQRLIWDWLKQYCANPAGQTPIYLGFGSKDRYYDAQKLLADGLPGDRIITVSGGHDADAFKRMWQSFLNKDILR